MGTGTSNTSDQDNNRIRKWTSNLGDRDTVEVKVQHKQAKKIGNSTSKREKMCSVLCIISFHILIVFVSLLGIVLWSSAEVAFVGTL